MDYCESNNPMGNPHGMFADGGAFVLTQEKKKKNKPMGWVCASKIISMKPCNFKEELPAPREDLINAG